MRSSVTVILVFCGLCLLTVNLTGCRKKEHGSEHAVENKTADSVVVRVVTSEIKEQPYEDWGSYSADLRGFEDAYLTAPAMGGRVETIKEVGSAVHSGDALCSIDGDKYNAAYQAALAQVEVAKGEYERAKVNVEKGSIGRAALESANLMYQNARLNLVNAQRAYDDCHCKAPFDGILVSRSVEKYQSVAPGAQTVRLSRIDRLEARISLPETEAFSYAEGMKTEFKLLQNPDRVYSGTITSLDRAVDSQSRTVTARITLLNPDRSLKPGMVGRVRILRKVYQSGIVVPSTSLLRLQDGIYAMVVENGMAKKRIVHIECVSEDKTLIKDGLQSGDKLITSGAFQVSEGTKVTF